MANGKITAKDTIESAAIIAQFNEVNNAASKLLDTFNQLQKVASNIKTPKQGDEVLRNTNKLNGDAINLLKKREELEGKIILNAKRKVQITKEEANTLAAQERAAKAAIQTKNAQLVLDKKLERQSSKNVSFYKKQSAILNRLRDAYKSLELKKQQGIKLTRLEEVAYAKLRTRVTQLNKALVKADAAAGQFNRNVGNYPKGLRLAAGALRSFASALGFTSGIFLFVAAIRDAFNRIREFDKAMQNISGILRTSRDDIADLEEEIIKVAGSSVKTSREVANLAESLVTLGKKDQDLINLLKPVNDLSIALETTSDKAAEFLVQTLNAFGAGSEQASEYADVIATIRTSTTLDFQKMADSFQYLTPISRILNKDLAYTGSILGILADNGLKAESAGRLLGTAQQRLAKGGLSLSDALETVNKAQNDGVEGVELLAIASDLFGKQAAKVGIILAQNTDKIEENAQAIRDNGGALDDLVKEQLKSLDANLKILDSTWEQYILTIENGNGTSATLFRNQIQGITGLISLMTDLEKASSDVFSITGNDGTGFIDRLDRSVFFAGLLNTEYDGLIERQREFNKFNNNIDANGIDILREEYKRLNEELDVNEELTISQRELYREQSKIIEQSIITKQLDRQELEATAIAYGFNEKELGKYADKISLYTDTDLEEFIRANERLAKSLKEVKDEFSGDFITLGGLRAELKSLTEEFEKTEINTPQFFAFQKEIAELEARIEKLTGKRKKANKEAKILVEGTIAYYEDLIKKEQEVQREQALTQDAYLDSAEKVEEYQKQIDALTGSLQRLNKLDVPDVSQGTTGSIRDESQGIVDTVFEGSGINSDLGLNAIRTPEDDAYANLADQASFAYERAARAAEESGDRQRAVLRSVLSASQEIYGIQLDGFINLLDEKETSQLTSDEKLASYAEAAQQTLLSFNNALLEGTLNRLDQERDANRAKLDRVLNDENASEEKKKAAQAKYDKQEAEIKRKQFEANKKAAIAQNLINTAVAITQAYAQLGPVGGTIAGVLITALSLVQLATIKKQKPPQFFKGKDERNNYEGLATWNEHRPEVNVDADGNVVFGRNKNELRYVSPEDIIHKSVPDFHRAVQDPSTTTYKRVQKSLTKEHVERTKMVIMEQRMHLETSGIESVMERVMMKYANRPYNVKAVVKQETKSFGF